MKKLAILPVVIVALAGCAVGPNYKRPAVSVPTDYRAATRSPAAPVSSLGNENWWDVYQDPVLVQLVHTALQQNYDVRIAATRILEAQAQVGITRANQFPSAGVVAGVNDDRDALSKFFGAYDTSNTELGLGFQWNLDFWGKYRSATKAARDQLLAVDWTRQEV